uniref:GntR family transcriptional regulator n=1 Tax=Pseudothermotoga hypogea TaxID=57487 RepID=A0A832I9E1_9THEM
MINKDSPVPLYYQIENILLKWITQHLKPGDLLPTEKELCEAFGVSRIVIRQALSELANRSMIRRKRGVGTVVIKPKIDEYLVSKLTGFYADMKSQGLEPVTKLLSKNLIKANELLAYYLGLDVGEKVFEIRRLRFVRDEPILIVINYIPEKFCPELLDEDLERQSLYEILESKFKIELVWGERTIEAISAGPDDSKLLQVKRGAPLIFLRSITYTHNNVPIEYYEAKHRADRTRFVTRLFKTSNLEAWDLEQILNKELKLTKVFNKIFDAR